MNHRQIKEAARALLDGYDLGGIGDLAKSEPRIIRALMGLLFDQDPLICMRAACALGEACRVIAESDIDRVRTTLTRILWQMNDESGALCWYGGEVLGEVLARVPALLKEYKKIVTNFAEEEPFERGTHYAMWRIAGAHKGRVRSYGNVFAGSIQSDDTAIRAYCIMGLCELEDKRAIELVRGLGEEMTASIFDPESGVFRETTLAELNGQVRRVFDGPAQS